MSKATKTDMTGAETDENAPPERNVFVDLRDNFGNVETRHQILSGFCMVGQQGADLLAEMKERRDYTEYESIWLMLQALTIEVIQLGLDLIEAQDKIAALEMINSDVTGPVVGGLMGFDRSRISEDPADDEAITEEQGNALDDETKMRRLKLRFHDTGALIRENCGLASRAS